MATRKRKVETNVVDRYAELAVLAAIHGRIAALAKAEMAQIESELLPDAARAGNLVINNTVVKYKKKTITTVPYSELHRRTMELLDEDLQKEVDTIREALTRKNVNESVEIIDPRIVKQTTGLSSLSLEELVQTAKLD